MRGWRLDVAGLIRMAAVLLAAITMTAATSNEAAARHHNRFTHHRCICQPARVAQITAAPAPPLGPMRYYGGPKSPMWRAPVEN